MSELTARSPMQDSQRVNLPNVHDRPPIDGTRTRSRDAPRMRGLESGGGNRNRLRAGSGARPEERHVARSAAVSAVSSGGRLGDVTPVAGARAPGPCARAW